jgi:hypothetical protein
LQAEGMLNLPGLGLDKEMIELLNEEFKEENVNPPQPVLISPNKPIPFNAPEPRRETHITNLLDYEDEEAKRRKVTKLILLFRYLKS